MTVTAATVKELRERTGVGIMDCKTALVEAAGDVEIAIEILRKSGVAKAAKKAGRTTAEGLIALAIEGQRAVLVEVNCETDFVAKDENFKNFSDSVANATLIHTPADIDALMQLPLDGAAGTSIEEARQALITKIGENVSVRQLVCVEGSGDSLGSYLHGGRIGVLVDVAGGDTDLAKDVAMHIAASRPVCVRDEDVPAELMDKEKEILTAQAAESGKPTEIIEKMVQGRLQKFLKEITLYGQPFVKDPETTVGKLLGQRSAEVKSFARLEVGEGIAKKQDDFAAEVLSQVRQAAEEQRDE